MVESAKVQCSLDAARKGGEVSPKVRRPLPWSKNTAPEGGRGFVGKQVLSHKASGPEGLHWLAQERP